MRKLEWRSKETEDSDDNDDDEEDPEDQDPLESLLGPSKQLCLDCAMTPCVCMLLKLNLKLTLLRKPGEKSVEEADPEEGECQGDEDQGDEDQGNW